MVKLTLEENTYSCQTDETVLEALLRENVNISYACKKGTCHSCMVRSPDTILPEAAQAGLKNTCKNAIIFLPVCVIRNRIWSLNCPINRNSIRRFFGYSGIKIILE